MQYFLPTPNSKPIPCEIIREDSKRCYVEVLDDRNEKGKRIWYNTDTYGSTMMIDKSQLQVE